DRRDEVHGAELIVGAPPPPVAEAVEHLEDFVLGRDPGHVRGAISGTPTISTKVLLNVAAAAGDARSPVRTLAQPLVSSPRASGVNQAPSLIDTQPGAMRSVTRAGRMVAPRWLNTRTRWPSRMPRAAASAGCIQTSSLSARERIGWLSWIECVRARDFGVQSRSGWLPSSGSGIHVGIAGIAPSP